MEGFGGPPWAHRFGSHGPDYQADDRYFERLLVLELIAIEADDTTAEAIGDWHYWAQGYCF